MPDVGRHDDVPVADPKQAARAAAATQCADEAVEDLPRSTSSAMPDLSAPTVPRLKARVHRRLSSVDCAKISVDSLSFRPLKASDAQEMIALHTEWFPVTYDELFYSKSVNGEIFTLAAVHRFPPTEADSGDADVLQGGSSSSSACANVSAAAGGASPSGGQEEGLADEEELLGIITMSTRCEHHGEDIMTVLGGDCASLCQLHDLQQDVEDGCARSSPRGALAYILTLGVVEGFRRRGLAKELLRRSIQYLDENMPHVQAVYLHVILYNDPAIQLYEAMRFLQLERYSSFYRLHGKMYDCFLYARYLHEGRPLWKWRFRRLVLNRMDWFWNLSSSFGTAWAYLFSNPPGGALEEATAAGTATAP